MYVHKIICMNICYVGEYECMYIYILSLLFILVFVIIYNFCIVPNGPDLHQSVNKLHSFHCVM